MTALRIRIGSAIRKLRKDNGVSQEALAHKAKLHRTTMSEIERGRTNVSIDIGDRIARALGIRLSELLAEAERQK